MINSRAPTQEIEEALCQAAEKLCGGSIGLTFQLVSESPVLHDRLTSITRIGPPPHSKSAISHTTEPTHGPHR